MLPRGNGMRDGVGVDKGFKKFSGGGGGWLVSSVPIPL